jgi:hypothetical protein
MSYTLLDGCSIQRVALRADQVVNENERLMALVSE